MTAGRPDPGGGPEGWRARLAEPGLRLFVAVPIPADTVRAVSALVEGVRATDGAAVVGPIRRGSNDVRWVRLDGLHVTLRFLGPTLENRVAAVGAAVEAAAADSAPFEVSLAGAGAFPNPDRPRALWLGVDEGSEALAALAAGLDAELVRLGWPPEERPFRAHLTLARSDGVRAGPRLARRLMEAADGFRATWRADRMVLFESRTGGGPARYVPLLEASLGAS